MDKRMTERASKHGVDVELILDEFIRIVENIPKDGFVIAHNMDHEHTVLTNSFSPDQRIVWNDAPKCDTWNVRLLKFLPEQVLIKYAPCVCAPCVCVPRVCVLFED